MTTPKFRRLQGRLATCSRCGAKIVWGRTTASENGPGGKPMPLDPVENPAGNVAVPVRPAGVLRARVLKADEHHSEPDELLAMPHFATCEPPKGPPAQLPPNVVDFAAAKAARAKKKAHR